MPGRCLLTVLSLAAMLAVGCESTPQNTRSTDPPDAAARGGEGEWSFELLSKPIDTQSVAVADPAAAEAVHEANGATKQKLRKKMPAEFEAGRLVNVIDYLRVKTGAQFFVNWAALEAAGVEQDSPVTLYLTDLPAEQVLKLVLLQVGGGAELEPIDHRVIEGVVHVSTRRDLDRVDRQSRVYDVRDLLTPDAAGAAERRNAISREDEESLLGLVEFHIGEYGPNDRTNTRIGFHEGRLLVTTTSKKHEMIAHLLAALRLSRQRAEKREVRQRR